MCKALIVSELIIGGKRQANFDTANEKEKPIMTLISV